jgi:hypothetical protein
VVTLQLAAAWRLRRSGSVAPGADSDTAPATRHSADRRLRPIPTHVRRWEGPLARGLLRGELTVEGHYIVVELAAVYTPRIAPAHQRRVVG